MIMWFNHANSNNIYTLQGSASECTLVTLLAARAAALRKLKEKYPDEEDGVLLSKLVAYCSKQVRNSSHYSHFIECTSSMI